MHMSSRSSGRGGRQVRELTGEETRSPDGTDRYVPAGNDRVLHFDQLDEQDQETFLRTLRGEPANLSLPAGTVVVFTGYYRVERA